MTVDNDHLISSVEDSEETANQADRQEVCKNGEQ
jgi:hypothetical protein